jgi:ankyrin repeat protein
MQNRTLRSAVLLSALVVSAAGLTSVAWAQADPMSPTAMMGRAAARAPDMNKPAVAPPPALPGAASHADTVAPATRIPTDMSPNDALFDAINRGDIAAARDALSRGAELNAQNLLGMTPMELSVDLGRNDISFLLLSYRSSDTSRSASASGQVAQAQVAQGQARRMATAGARSKAAAVVKTADRRAQAVQVKTEVAAAPQTPRLFANDGGTPVPGAGFLGFGTGR